MRVYVCYDKCVHKCVYVCKSYEKYVHICVYMYASVHIIACAAHRLMQSQQISVPPEICGMAGVPMHGHAHIYHICVNAELQNKEKKHVNNDM